MREAYSPGLKVLGVIVNRVERTAEHGRRLAELGELYGDALWLPFVPKRAAIQEAHGAGRRLLDAVGAGAAAR